MRSEILILGRYGICPYGKITVCHHRYIFDLVSIFIQEKMILIVGADSISALAQFAKTP